VLDAPPAPGAWMRAMIARLLEGDADVTEIRARDAEIRARGLRACPPSSSPASMS
jgi:hypothetical protein